MLELSYAQKPVDNYTADVFYPMNIVSDEDAANPGLGAQFNMKQDGNKILCTIDMAQVYIEQTEKGVLTYVFDGNKWVKEEVDLEEFNKMIEYPEVGYTAEFFETVDGCYYYGKEYKMNIALDDYFTELEEEFVETFKTEFKDEIKEIEKKTEKKVTITCNAFITEYIIQVVDNVIKTGNYQIELGGEKVDLIAYSQDMEEFIANALSPAKNLNVSITDEKKKEALVIADDENLSLAIGKKGINVKLASKLTKYTINIKTLRDINAEINK